MNLPSVKNLVAGVAGVAVCAGLASGTSASPLTVAGLGGGALMSPYSSPTDPTTSFEEIRSTVAPRRSAGAMACGRSQAAALSRVTRGNGVVGGELAGRQTERLDGESKDCGY